MNEQSDYGRHSPTWRRAVAVHLHAGKRAKDADAVPRGAHSTGTPNHSPDTHLMISHASPLLVATLAQLENLTAEIATLEETVKDRKAYRKYVGENVLPELIGHEQLNDGALMPDGTCVTFEHDYHASIAPKDRAQAHQFLIENGRADLLKCSLTVSLGRNELAKEHVLVNVLRLIPGVEVVSETQLPGPTLMKYVRERLSAGEHLPEYFGVYAPLRAIPRPPPK